MDNSASLDHSSISLPYLRQFVIEYESKDFTQRASIFNLSEKNLSDPFLIHLSDLEAYYLRIENSDEKQAMHALFMQVATWPEHLSIENLTQKLNTCIDAWIDAFNAKVSAKAIFDVMKCTAFHDHHLTPAWHLFLFDLISETLLTQQQYQIQYLLAHDTVTNLPNTNALLQTLNHDVNDHCTILTIRFIIERGSITLSPILPTTLSIKIVELLTDALPDGAKIYQCGNLLFSALIEKELTDTQLNLLFVKIQRSFEQIINLDHQAFLVTPYVAANSSSNDENKGLIYYQARTALDYGLEKNKHFVIYSEEISTAFRQQKELDLAVTNAFNNEDLELYLQPILGLPEAKCVGAEVLLRWPNATNKGIYPNVVVEIINKVGLGKQFTRWLIHSVCRLAGELIHQHQLPIYLTLNLRAEDLYDTELPHLIQKSTEFWKIKPTDIVLEITENGILEENETTSSIIKQITDNGFKLALDDFGTGYSSMARLRTMPISLIKIDQSFVKTIDQSKEDYEIVQSMAMLANSLGKDVLVEGLETKQGLDLINQIGIKKAQGYYFSKPMPYMMFIDWAKNNIAS